MKAVTRVSLGILLALVCSGAPGQVRVVVREGRTVLVNDGPAKIAATPQWLAARVSQASAYDDLIARAAGESSVDPRLVKSVMLVESGFDPAAVSRKGARGLMQLMPEIAAEQGIEDVHDPAQNISAGVRHLSRLLERYGGDIVKSLAAYNAGEAAVEKYDGVPPYEETRLYVRKTLAAYYGRPVLGGGFGKSPEDSYKGAPAQRGKAVRWIRDSRTNRVILTTKGQPVARRLG
jgi:soluble lytic murein transglycosylase-like protein